MPVLYIGRTVPKGLLSTAPRRRMGGVGCSSTQSQPRHYGLYRGNPTVSCSGRFAQEGQKTSITHSIRSWVVTVPRADMGAVEKTKSLVPSRNRVPVSR